MNSLSFIPKDQDSIKERDTLSIFQKKAAKSGTIREGMSAKEIADVVSDKVIKEVQRQFEATKKQYLSQKGI